MPEPGVAPSAPATALGAVRAVDLLRVVTGFRDAVQANREAINRLNVYPVPDGDTGTNMALTLESVVAEIELTPGAHGADGTAVEMAALCHAVGHGSLMGARGNSGVILSQILRGVATGCRGHEAVGPVEFAAALQAAATAAYDAVLRPVEGTILTVARRAGEAAVAAAADGVDLVAVLQAARTAAGEALAQTPELLPVLKQAGVVDAGGQGFCFLLDAALHVVDGRPVPHLEVGSVSSTTLAAGAGAVQLVDHGHGAPGAGLAELRYEVMYLLEAPETAIPAFKDVWAGLGDSIVVVGGDGLWNCHIHTDDIGGAIEAALDIGRPRNIRVTDLLDELEEERWVRDAEAAGAVVDEPPHVNEPVRTAVVAVASGDGIRRLFLSLGVQRVVTGGQSMNPSTAQLLEAVESAPADEVVLLPNNKNIVPVAEQVGALTAKQVRVLPTKGVTEGLAAAMQYDPEGGVDANLRTMTAAAASVVSGEVTVAVRDSVCDAGPIAEGDHLGISRDGIVVVAPVLADALTSLLSKLVTDEHEIVTLIEGEGSSSADTRRVGEWLTDHRPGVTLEVHHGGQPLYPYLVGVE